MKDPIASYLRHLIVCAIVALAAKWQLPQAGVNEFAQGVALIVIGTGTWAVVKYAPAWLKKILGLGAIAILAGGGLLERKAASPPAHTLSPMDSNRP